MFEYQVGDCFQPLQLIWRIRKYKVKLVVTTLDIFEYISSDGNTFVSFDFIHDFTNEGMMISVFFNADYLVASA